MALRWWIRGQRRMWVWMRLWVPQQMAQGQAPDNFLALEELSNFERSHLKEAFSVVQTLQGVLGQRYQTGRY